MSDKTIPLFFALRKEQGNGFNQTANKITYLIKKLVWKFSLFIKKLNLLIRVFMYMYLRNPYQNINHIIRSSETGYSEHAYVNFKYTAKLYFYA